MPSYKTPNGNILEESVLREQYGERFDKFVAEGLLILVEDDENLKKKDSDLPAPEEVTESITETQTTPTSSDSSLNPSLFREMTTEEKVATRQGTPYDDTEEKDTLIERALGKNAVTDFLGDMYRAGATGYQQGQSVDEALEVLAKGSNVSNQDVEEYIAAVQETGPYSESDEMKDFYKTYNKEGQGIFGVLKGLYNNPSILPEVLVSSVASMMNPATAAGGAAGALSGGVVGSTGFSLGPLGVFTTLGGAVSGFFGGATTTLETAMTFNELLREELGNKEFNKENIKAILNNPEKLSSLRFRAVGRGATIGSIDAMTAGLAGAVTKKLVKAGVKKSLAGAAGGGIEMVGGSLGEVGGKAVAGQEMDVADIFLEGAAGLGSAPLTVGAKLFSKNKPTYKLNGENVTKEFMLGFVNQLSDENISSGSAKIEINNDPELKGMLESRLEEYSLNKDIPANIANPETRTKLVELEKERKSLENKTTQSAKNRVIEIDNQIKNLQQDAIQEQETGDILDAEPAESVQEVEEEVREPSIETEEKIKIKSKPALDPVTKETIDSYELEGEEKENRLNFVEKQIEKDIQEGKSVKEIVQGIEKRLNLDKQSKNKVILYITDRVNKKTTQSFSEWNNSKPTPTEQTTEQEVKVYDNINDNLEVFGEFTKNVESGKDLANIPVEVQNIIDLGQRLDEQGATVEVTRDLGIVDGRQILEITASNGEKFLMYKSKGTGTGAASKGKWVPLPGFAKDGYFIKGAFNPETGKTFIPTGPLSEVNNPKFNKYGSETFKKLAEQLESETTIEETPTAEVVKEEVVEEKTTKQTTKQTSKAESLKKRINKLSKSPDVEGTVAQSVKEFLKINPRTVNDINAYISQAEAIVEGLKKSRTFKGDVKIAESVDIKKLDEYSSKELKAQDQTLREKEAKAFEELTGLSSEELSLGEMREILNSVDEESVKTPKEIKLKAEKKADIIARGIKKAFSTYSAIIKKQIKTGIDPFTGDQVKISANDQKIIENFLNVDLDNLSPAEQLRALDALTNFATNQTTGGMNATIFQDKGVKEAKAEEKKGLVAKPLQIFKRKGLSQAWIKYIASLPISFELMFKGQSKGLRFEQASGFSDIKNGSAKAEAENNQVFDKYIKKYKKTKPNGEAFNTVDNDVERGMFAFMRRTVDGTLEEQQKEFKRRKGLVEQSIDRLKKTGETNDQTKAEVYEKIYDKILKDATTIDEVDAKVDATNKEAVEWITNEWAARRDDLADISLNVYNRILGKDINYTPDSFTLIEEPSSTADIGEPIFEGTREVIYDKETGVLKPKNPSFVLPENRIINLGFDSQNSRSLNAALTDIYTAEGIQQLKGFVNSDAYSKIIPNKSDRDLITERLRRYIDAKRGVSFIKPSNKAFIRGLNKFSSLAVGRALGGPTQFIKQLVPIVNTMANAGPVSTIKGLTLLTNPAVNKFLNNSGYGIANRGLQSLSSLESSNSKIENAAKSNLGKAVDQLDKVNQAYLKAFVANPDKFAARASWLSYYTNSLKKQGINPNGIDWNTHKINKEAADFAEQQVSRQQNVSDIDLQGEIFNSKNPFIQFGRKVVLPFANFLLNQKTRMYSDLSTLASQTSTSQDKKTSAKSLGGLAAETIAFNAIGLILLQALDLATIEEDDEERKQKMLENRVKGRLGNMIKDIVSPLPVTDVAIIAFANYLLRQFFEEEPEELVQLSTSRKTAQPKKKETFQLFSEDRKSAIERLGVLGINLKNATYIYDVLYPMAERGEYQKEYMGKKGKVKKIDPKYNDVAKMNLVAYLLYTIGLLPSETANIVRGNVKDMQKQKQEIKLSTSR